MKRIISVALALSLLGSTAAMADGWRGHGPRSHYGWSHGHYHRGNNNAAAAIGLGILGLGALAIISQQNARDRDAYYDRYDDRYAPPPAAYDDGYGPPPAPNEDSYDRRFAPQGNYDGYNE